MRSPWLGSVGVAGPDGPAAVVAWWTALQVTSWMTVGGLVAVVALSPIAYWRMVAGPRRRARVTGADDADAAATGDAED